MQKLSRGVLITVEGIDCCGKSTLIHNLAPLLAQMPVVFTKEPGDTALGKQIKEVVRNLATPLDSKAEFLLYAADRAQHIHEVVKPAIFQKKLVISDRMADSSVVYQGYARGLSIEIITQVNAWAMDNIEPDLTFFVVIDPIIACQRTQERTQAINKSFWCSDPNLYYMQRVAEGYTKLFAQRKNIITLDGTKTPEILAQQTADAINTWLKNNNLYV